MNPHYANIFAYRLKIARTAKKISQQKLGIMAGIDENSASARMNQYEKGKHVPDFLTINKIAESLKLPTAYFFVEVENELFAQLLLEIYQLTKDEQEQLLQTLHQRKTNDLMK